ncbi:MAG: hypothetical protein ACUVWP_07875 [bacterium]
MRYITLLVIMGLLLITISAKSAGFIPGLEGGIAVKGGTTVLAGARLNFEANKYLLWGFEARYTHATGSNGVAGGLDLEYHIVPGMLPVIDPYLGFGGGYRFNHTEGDNSHGGYVQFGGAMDLMPFKTAPVKPFIEIGAIITFGGGIDTVTAFLLQGGIKFNL